MHLPSLDKRLLRHWKHSDIGSIVMLKDRWDMSTHRDCFSPFMGGQEVVSRSSAPVSGGRATRTQLLTSLTPQTLSRRSTLILIRAGCPRVSGQLWLHHLHTQGSLLLITSTECSWPVTHNTNFKGPNTQTLSPPLCWPTLQETSLHLFLDPTQENSHSQLKTQPQPSVPSTSLFPSPNICCCLTQLSDDTGRYRSYSFARKQSCDGARQRDTKLASKGLASIYN